MAVKLIRNLILDKPLYNNGQTQTNSYIVIHNTSGGTAKSNANYFKSNTKPSGERYGVFTHYTVDDKEIYQLLHDDWGAMHCGSGGGHYAAWGSGVPGISNKNAIGIEVADGSTVDHLKAIENAIELTRYLMKTYNITTIVRHGDVQDKGCPETIMKLGKWNYFVSECKNRNANNQNYLVDFSDHLKVGMTSNDTTDNSTSDSTGGSGGSGVSGNVTIELTFNNTTTVQESLPNANTSDNWVDMHKIKGITLHQYPPYHNCVADSMAKRWKNMNWNTNFHYKVDKDTKIDFSKKPVSGQTTGGNIVGTSESDFEVKAKDPLYSGISIDINANSGGGGTDTTASTDSSGDGKGSTTPERIYIYCKSQGCTDEAAAGVIANCECECNFDCKLVNSIGASGLFQWLSGRLNKLKEKAKAAGKDWTDVDIQIQHMWAEFTGEESTTVALLNKRVGGVEGYKKLTDAYKAGYEFGKCFERGGYEERRGERAKKWLEFIKANDFSKCADGSKLPSNAIFASSSSSSSGDGTIFGWPIPNCSTIPNNGRFGDPRDGGARKHAGLDISVAQGTEIKAYAGGTVEKAVNDGGYNNGMGNNIKIKHSDNCSTVYYHLKTGGLKVKTGDTVKAGQVIAEVGNTGASTGPHLHFGIYVGGATKDPLLYIKPGGGVVAGANPLTSTKTLAYEPEDDIKVVNIKAFDVQDNDEPFGWPIPNETHIQSYYGYRTDIRGYSFHPGIDIMSVIGNGVYAYDKGIVEKVVIDPCMNGYIKIDHGNGIKTVYAALKSDAIYVKEKDDIKKGQLIAQSYKTVYNELMHLHFEIWVNDKRVDPLEYVKPGGGNYKIPTAISTKDISTENKNITWDNIDKGKIVFASYQNNKHTYIDANMFNNQHPKYTLSIGAFFYDESDLVEKSKNISWPTTEKKLIEQCAKALYDEGFTSTQLWREFDLNRAPSPFLYLDKDKWIAFCVEVDKQVEWLNTKYGKVTATYIPNNLLTNNNKNEFVETAPDGGILNVGTITGSNQSNVTTNIDSMENGLFIGDSWGVGIEEFVKKDNGISECKGGVTVSYYYDKKKKSDRIKNMDDNAKFVYSFLTINDAATIAYSNYTPDSYKELYLDYLNAIRSKYSTLPIFIGKGVLMSEAKDSTGHNKKINTVIPELNKILEEWCASDNNAFLIDISSGFVDSDGKISKDKCAADGEHLNEPEVYYNNIKSAITSTSITTSTSNDSASSDTTTDTDKNTSSDTTSSNSDTNADNSNKGKYAWVNVKDAKLYKKSDTASTVLKSLAYGQELHIIAANGIFYQVTCAGQSGYVRAKNIEIIKNNTYGYTYKTNINHTATVLANTAMYQSASISSKIVKTIPTAQQVTIVDTAINFYKVKYGLEYGYVKAYRCTNISNLISMKAVDSNIIADKNNVGKFCYFGDSNSGSLLSSADPNGKVLASLVQGDEMKITGVSTIYYKVDFNKKSGYVLSSEVYVLNKAHGETKPNSINQNAYVRFDNTELFESLDSDKILQTLKIEDKLVIKAISEKNGMYKVIAANNEGWVKAYCITFDPSIFDIQFDNTTNENMVSNPTTDDNAVTKPISINGGDFEDSSLGDWATEGKIGFMFKNNPEWAQEGHWSYRGLGFARIQNIQDKLAGIKHDIIYEDSEDKDFTLRVTLWLKVVTQDDEADAHANYKSLKNNGLYIKLLNKNDKVTFEKKLDFSTLVDTKWGRLGAVFYGVKKEDAAKIFIGNNKQFDLYIDDLDIEKIEEINNSIGNSNSTSAIDMSGVGTTAIDNGGVMIYDIDKPKNSSATQPDIATIITQEEYEKIMENASYSLIDNYTNSFEPYDKDLDIAKTIGVTNDMRLENLPETINTFTNNIIRYKVTETGPGSIDHCVKPVDELSVLYKNTECLVDPIYPDLIIPPKYTTTENDKVSKNILPMTTLEAGKVSLQDTITNNVSYDYDLLEEMNKKSSGKPANYDDPYPYDDKIQDLEQHEPKVLIDEIESRLYTCNHPGSPLAQEMAKNFGMMADMAIQQSKVTEQRLVRIENTLSTMMRNIGRVGARVNINCVYYGGQDVFGKYKTIRCLRDDRVHDACSVTLDQCLCCTRYEPIIGQIYDILGKTGMNGSAILDDMQMSYMELDDFKNLNKVERKASKWDYINTNKQMSDKDVPKDIKEEWKKEDLKLYTDNLKKTITDKKKLQEKIDAIKEEDYIFRMDWSTDNVDLHAPDIKPYPTEKIAAKYKQQYGDPANNAASAEEITKQGMDTNLYDTIANSQWVDTRKQDDTMTSNKYTSFDFYFENFNLNRTGYEYDNGLKGNVGLTGTATFSGSGGTTNSSLNGAECRKIIVDTALKIVEQHKNKEACYSNDPRTIDMNNPKHISGTYLGMNNPIGYDCTSLVSCCYRAAGLKSFYDGRTGQGNVAENTLVQEVIKGGGEIWWCDEAGISKALPGDVLMSYTSALNKTDVENNPKVGCKASHAMIYCGDGKIAHSSQSKPAPDGIKYEDIPNSRMGRSFFIRPKELIDADNAANSSSSGGGSVQEVAGTVDGLNYVCKLGSCVTTQYGTWDGSVAGVASGKAWSKCLNTSAASHNLPYGTKVYSPQLKGKLNATGIFTVEDTGGPTFDFDLCTSKCISGIPYSVDCYILEYGTGKTSASFRRGLQMAPQFKSVFKKRYIDKDGKLATFFKFSTEDKGLFDEFK